MAPADAEERFGGEEESRELSLVGMTREYVVALSIVAVLALVAAAGLAIVIRTEESAAVAVNVSGRQRMLSQRIVLLSLRLSADPGPAEERRVRGELRGSILLMESSHDRLLRGQGAIPAPSPQVLALFHGPNDLDGRIDKFLNRARRIADNPNAPDRNDQDLRFVTRESESALLVALDRVVAQYELESEEDIGRIVILVWFTTFALVLVLVAEALWIFRPLVNRVAGQTTQLEERYEQEHHIAGTLQRRLAPREVPAIAGLEITFKYQSATRAAEVGGDFYDFFELEGGRWGIVMGDVEGHGVEAAAETAKVKYLLRDKALSGLPPVDAVKALNQSLNTMKTEHFTALTYGVYDPITAEFVFTNAGNPFPFFSRTSGFVEISGIPVGVLTGQDYDLVRFKLEPGEFLLFFTDGLVEARRGPKLFQARRVSAYVQRHKDELLELLILGLVEKAQAFAGGRLSDDILIIGIRKT